MLRQLGVYSRRHLLGRERERLFLAAFPEFCYQPFADAQDIVGLANFPELANRFKSFLNINMLGSGPEIYHLIDAPFDNQHSSIFDLRTVSRNIGGGGYSSHTGTVFLIDLPEYALTEFSLCRDGLLYAVLWGEDPDIDIEDEVVFSQTFHLTGPDRAAVTRLFDKSLVSFFRTHSMLFAAGSLGVRQHALYFQYAEALAPEEIRSTLDVLSRLIQLIK